jgi:hypothetical protein
MDQKNTRGGHTAPISRPAPLPAPPPFPSPTPFRQPAPPRIPQRDGSGAVTPLAPVKP